MDKIRLPEKNEKLIKWRKQVKETITAWYCSIALYIMFLFMFNIGDRKFRTSILIQAICAAVVGITYLVCYIISIVHAGEISRIDGEHVPFILLLVGILVNIVGIVGLYLFKNQIDRLIAKQRKDDTNLDQISLP